jgi:hypothetical protein
MDMAVVRQPFQPALILGVKLPERRLVARSEPSDLLGFARYPPIFPWYAGGFGPPRRNFSHHFLAGAGGAERFNRGTRTRADHSPGRARGEVAFDRESRGRTARISLTKTAGSVVGSLQTPPSHT